MVAGTGIRDVVRLLEPLPQNEIPNWLRTLDVFVLPSLTEGCPNILMEAMACGVPSIATRTGANEALVEDRVSGLLVPWGNSQALHEALEEIIEHPEAARCLGESGRAQMTQFSAVRERQAWEDVYRELMRF
jgi:glycosyltransferase involved in cell wall biosynthesis